MIRAGLATVALAALLALAATPSQGEQFQQFGQWRVHYIAFNTSLLSPRIASRYQLVRGRDKALVNISAIGPTDAGDAGEAPRRVTVTGRLVNLLGQPRRLAFREIDDGGAVYYLAEFDFEDAETLRFEITLELPGHGVETLSFQQPLYHSDTAGQPR